MFLVAVGFLLVGCGPPIAGTAAPATRVTKHITVPPSNVSVPPVLPPSASAAACPFVDTDEVQNDNGQHVGSVKISSTSDGQPHPVCYFYRPDGHLELTIRVYVGSPAVATAVVNQAAPISTSDPANQPAGWNGGSMARPKGAVYAISKGGTAIVVISNQLQTIKCRLVATAVVAKLGG